jgi:7-cyano-7-deazaguanine tRNA-ribosyltransferase
MLIEKPFLWFTQTIKGTPKPWLLFKLDGLMLNAYEILQNNSASERIREVGIHRYMGFEGPVTIDSGGFLFMKKKKVNIKPEVILKFYEDSKPNFGVVLDYPLVPNLPYAISKRRLLKTLENTRCMLKLRKTVNPELIPVIHGYNLRSINWYLKKLQEIGEFDVYGIGSLVPSVFNTKGVGGIYNVVRVVSWVRKILPTKIVHVFGVGSTLTMHLMFYAGADSVDSSAWRTKAAFGAIQLPGTGDRYISTRDRHKKYLNLSKEEKKVLDECRCPACRNFSIQDLRNSFELRAIHNAWIYQKECERARKLIKNDEYEIYVKDIIGKTRFSRILNAINRP